MCVPDGDERGGDELIMNLSNESYLADWIGKLILRLLKDIFCQSVFDF